jgi:hypothetical protein
MSASSLSVTATTGLSPDIPEGVKVGDFIVAKYKKSDWVNNPYFELRWENWHHAAMITGLSPLKIIEASGILLGENEEGEEVREGVVEYEFQKPRDLKKLNGEIINGNLWVFGKDLLEVKWLHSVFPNPLREKDSWLKPWILRKKITEAEARKRAVAYARKQIGEPFAAPSSKWNTKEWYCSKLIFKAYSLTVTNMYLESYHLIGALFTGRSNSGPMVTPEDLVDSKRSEVYHSWKKKA